MEELLMTIGLVGMALNFLEGLVGGLVGGAAGAGLKDGNRDSAVSYIGDDVNSPNNHGNSMTVGSCVNPASGLPMISDDCSGVDVMGNPFGMDEGLDSGGLFDDDLGAAGGLGDIGGGSMFDD
jgi:hypothetical protein